MILLIRMITLLHWRIALHHAEWMVRIFEPARILTHFESDYGAAPKVEMRSGQSVTNIMPDFSFKKHIGLEVR